MIVFGVRNGDANGETFTGTVYSEWGKFSFLAVAKPESVPCLGFIYKM
jgi:hypothetical protein